MATTVEAVYEGGVFRPVRKVSLAEGTHVEVTIPQAAGAGDPKAVAAKLAALAARSPRGGGVDATSMDPDSVLYGERKR